MEKQVITVQTSIKAPLAKVWTCWNEPEHIMKWCQASEDWHAPFAENDVRKDGKFRTTMAARDGSMSFDFEGVYTKVENQKEIAYEMSDGRKARILFEANGAETKVTESFEAETENPAEMQQAGWQAILDNFKKYTEQN